MAVINESQNLDINDMTSLIASRIRVNRDQVFSFADRTEFLTNLLKNLYKPTSRLITAGQFTPDIAIAADRAEMDLAEVRPRSPFAATAEGPLAEVACDSDIIYVSNPNRITGADFSLSDLELMARAVPEGALIVDEYYFDFYGITACSLLSNYSNVVVLRSFAASFGIYSSDAGYAVADQTVIRLLTDSFGARPVSLIVRKTILATLTNDKILSERIDMIRDEALRLSKVLNRLGVQSRITATDFLLLRVASPKDVGNELATSKVSVENLDGYPQMKNYVRFRIESPLSNDKFLGAFEKMPPQKFRMRKTDQRALTMRRDESQLNVASDAKTVDTILSDKIKQRKTPVVSKPEPVAES